MDFDLSPEHAALQDAARRQAAAVELAGARRFEPAPDDLVDDSAWARLSAKHWRSNRNHVMGYGTPFGHEALRQAVAAHLRANRGIVNFYPTRAILIL